MFYYLQDNIVHIKSGQFSYREYKNLILYSIQFFIHSVLNETKNQKHASVIGKQYFLEVAKLTEMVLKSA